MKKLLFCTFFLLIPSLWATNYTVKSGGGGNFTTMSQCASQMATNGTGVSDTCTVFAGTYNETVTMAAGSASIYKIWNVNGSDAVIVNGFVGASHNKITGNCTAPATPGACGFSIQDPSAPGSGCISLPNGTTDLYIVNNSLTECVVSATAMIDCQFSNVCDHIYIQGNTISYAGVLSGVQVSTTGTWTANSNTATVAAVGGAVAGGSGCGESQGWVVYGAGLNTSNGIRISAISGSGPYTLTLAPVSGGGNSTNANETNTAVTLTPPVCDDIYASGDHWLIEGNDFSHYTLSILMLTKYGLFRNNTFHDQQQYEGAGNSHTDTLFSEPGQSVNVQYNFFERNTQRNAFGVDAKGQLSQGESCGGTCQVLVHRFNIVSRIGGGVISNNTTWDATKSYNNDYVDTLEESTFACGNATTNNSTPNIMTNTTTRSSYFNDIYYYTESGATTGCINPYSVSTTNGSSATWGYNLAFCQGGCGTLYGHLYQSTSPSFAGEPGQAIGDPKFVNYISAGNVSNDYHLKAGSPAIAAGTNLTTVAAGDSGSGTSLVVNDASFFQDGMGLTNANSTVSGDCISVTTVGNHVCITAVNYTTNTLTMASGFSRSSGDKIWLYSDSSGTVDLIGVAPDIGALPSTQATQPNGAAHGVLFAEELPLTRLAPLSFRTFDVVLSASSITYWVQPLAN